MYFYHKNQRKIQWFKQNH